MTIDSELDNILWKYGVWEDLPNEKLIKLSKDLKKWAAQEANKARLDELKALQTKWYQYANGKMSPKPNPNEDWLGADIYDRIAQLTTDKEKA